MSKKSTTKITILLFSILSCLVLFSCVGPNNTANNDDTIDKSNLTREEILKSMAGTWIFEKSDNGYSLGTIVIDDIIEVNSINFGFPQRVDDLIQFYNFSDKQVNEHYIETRYEPAKEAFSEALQKYSHFTNYDLCVFHTDIVSEENEGVTISNEYISNFYIFSLLDNKLHVLYYKYYGHKPQFDETTDNDTVQYYECIYTLKQTTDNENNNDDNNSGTSITESDITGSYTISEANGSTFTFASDGTWTYKYNSSTTEGSWSVSDGELTITYSLGGYSSTAVFTASVSGDTYTLTGKSGDYTTIISSAFKITDQEALENGVVTLVKQ